MNARTLQPEITLEDRAANGEKCIRAVSDRDDGAPDELVIDALADIMHYCRSNDVEFDTCRSMAEIHYQSETSFELMARRIEPCLQ